MNVAILVSALGFALSQSGQEVTATEKKAFLDLLSQLPTQGEFFTDDAVQKAAPHTRVLLALTKKDIANNNIYPFFALSRGLLDRKEKREYGVKHCGRIAHPEIKLFWGSVLFDEKLPSPEVVRYLRAALESKEQAQILSQMIGPNFEDFKKRVKEYKLQEK
jgi:hypothetical protein